MDLLGRKSKALLAQAYDTINWQGAREVELVHILTAQKEWVAQLSSLVQSRESLISDLLREVGQLEGRLAERDAVKTGPPPVHLDEEHQELEYQRDNNLISLADYEHLLQELEFQNSTIELDPDYRPRPDLTY